MDIIPGTYTSREGVKTFSDAVHDFQGGSTGEKSKGSCGEIDSMGFVVLSSSRYH